MYKISPEYLQKIVNYLAARPYQEVFELINVLTKLEQVKEPEEPVEADKQS